MEIYTNTVDQDGKIEVIRFMPNIHDIQNLLPNFRYFIPKYEQFFTRTFGYIYKDGVIVPFKVNQTIYKTVKQYLQGYYGNKDGQILLDQYSPKSYFVNKNGWNVAGNMNLDDSIDETITEHFDIIKYDPINISDLQCDEAIEYTILTKEVKVENKEPLKFVINSWPKRVKHDPIWTKGMDKDAIIKLYDNVPKLTEVIQLAKDNLIQKHPDVLFDENARLAYRLNLQSRQRRNHENNTITN